MNHTILILNDEPAILEMVHVLLEEAGHQVVSTTDSHQALALLRQGPIDLFIQDIERPDMDGLELYKRMKSEEQLRDIPILLFTAHPTDLMKLQLDGSLQESLYRVTDTGEVRVWEIGKPVHECLYRVEFGGEVLHVEGYLSLPSGLKQLESAVEQILQKHSRSLRSEEQRAFRRSWLQAARLPAYLAGMQENPRLFQRSPCRS